MKTVTLSPPAGPPRRSWPARALGALPFLAGLLGALALGWVGLPLLLYESIAQPLPFSHATHTGDAVGLSCEECHPLGDDGRFAGLPALASCAECHEEPQGETPEEARFVAEYVATGREVPWLVYARQPDNAWFPHAAHVKGAGIACERCHGDHGRTAALRPFERNRLTGYSRDVWGPRLFPQRGLKMSDCEACHADNGVETGCQDCHR